MLKRRSPKRRKAAANPKAPAMPTAPNERWAMDFVHDTLAAGGTLCVLSMLDVYTRECLALVPRRRFPGPEVVKVVAGIGTSRGLTERISVDNGTGFTSKILDF